tara:strand:+ start:23994 stop:24650 length:657 start_codon:yes stop_codon:yes gene_type:complete
MKNLFFLTAFIVLGTGSLFSQDKDQVRDRDQDRVMLVDGDVLQIRDRDQIRLQAPITLNDGTMVNADGSYVTRDRDRLQLKDGECLDNDGIKYRNEYQYRYKVQQENKGLSEAQIKERNQNRYQIMLINGEAFQIRNQEQNRLQQQLNLGDGIVVNPDGSYQDQQRKQLKLQEGECINMDGAIFKNTYQHRKIMAQKNMMKKKVKTKPMVQKNKKSTK